MKKILAICLSAIAVLSLAGCGSQAATTPSENAIIVSKLDVSENSVEEMCLTMKEKGYIPNDGVKMNSEIIGAKSGYRFVPDINGAKATVEVYEFDTANINEDGKKTIDSVKETGKFTIIDNEVSAQMSDNGKYMMIYTDEKTEGDKPTESNVQRKKDITQVFNSEK